MHTTTSARKPAPAPEPKQFDWFMGLLYAVCAVGFIAIAAIFIMLLGG